jgi:ADP-heptose:LPS heptosyltransferase
MRRSGTSHMTATMTKQVIAIQAPTRPARGIAAMMIPAR